MKFKFLLLGVAVVAALALIACGDDDDAGATATPTIAPAAGVTGATLGIGPGLSVAEALSSTLDGPLLVNGFLVAVGDAVRLCELLAESFPPQCGGASLVVEGLDLGSMEGLTTNQDVTWSDQTLQILGSVEGDVLTVAATARG